MLFTFGLEIICTNKKNKDYDEKLSFQNINEQGIEENIVSLENQVKMLEQKCKMKGLSLDQANTDEFEAKLADPNFIEMRKRDTEKHSIAAIHKKFYGKIVKQKEQLERTLFGNLS